MGTVDFEILDTPEFAKSPLRIVFEQGIEVRGRMDDPDSKRFPFLDDMRAEGVTDYIAVPMPFLDGSIHATSWVTRDPGGFSDDDIAAIRTIMAPLARVSEIVTLRRTASMLLDTYVGNRAGAAYPRRPDPPRSQRHHAGCDLAVGFARLHRAVGPAAGRDRGRDPQPLFRLPGHRDPRPWRRGPEVHGRRPARSVSDRRICRRCHPCLHARAGSRTRSPRQRRCARAPRRRRHRALPLRRRAACRQYPLRQYRRRQPARLHLHRPGRQSRGAA